MRLFFIKQVKDAAVNYCFRRKSLNRRFAFLCYLSLILYFICVFGASVSIRSVFFQSETCLGISEIQKLEGRYVDVNFMYSL